MVIWHTASTIFTRPAKSSWTQASPSTAHRAMAIWPSSAPQMVSPSNCCKRAKSAHQLNLGPRWKTPAAGSYKQTAYPFVSSSAKSHYVACLRQPILLSARLASYADSVGDKSPNPSYSALKRGIIDNAGGRWRCPARLWGRQYQRRQENRLLCRRQNSWYFSLASDQYACRFHSFRVDHSA